MRTIRKWAAVALLCLLQYSVVRTAQSAEQAGEKGRRKRRALQEADEDAVFAAAVLGFVHDRVRDVGDVFRVVGDTAGGLAGGSIKAVGASVNGLSSVLDAASRGVATKPKSANKQPLPPLDSSDDEVGGPKDHRTGPAPDDSAQTRPSENRSSTNGKKKGKGGNPDPFERIETVALSSLSGALKILSAAVGGVGEAVFQTGTVAEGLAGGTGQVAEDLVRVVQGAVGWARDDLVKLNGRNSRPFDASSGPNLPPGQWSPSGNTGATSSEQTTQSETKSPSTKSPAAAAAAGFYSAREIWERVCGLARIFFEAALREAATLFRRRNGAPPPAPRFAVLMVLTLVLWSRRRRHDSPPPPPPPPPPPLPQPSSPSTPPPSRETAAPATPQRRVAARSSAPPRNESGQGAPTPMSAAAAGLASPSRSLFVGSRALGSSTAPSAPGSPATGPRGPRGPLEELDGLDPSLPSPAVARAGQARTGRARISQRQPWTGEGVRGRRSIREVARRAWGWVGGAVVAPGQWGWRWVRSRVWRREERSGGGRRCWVWLVLLWLVASVLEERERDRVAWLAWDEGFRAGQAFRLFDPSVEAETAVWLNHAIAKVWGGHGTASLEKRGGISVNDDRVDGALDGLSSFVSERVVEGILEALEKMKPTSIVGVELQEVELGSSAPQILGVKVLDPASPASPGWGDDRCNRGVQCMSFRVDLEMATQGLRVGVRVKASSLEKARVPAGTVRLLELFFRGSVSVRAELRNEFPFVTTALVSFDDVPDVEVRLEQWGLDALTLGAVDEWARIGLRQALRPFVLPGFLEVDTTDALCPECAQRERTKALQPSHHALPSSRLSAAAAAMSDPPVPSASGSGNTGTASSSKSLRRERGANGVRLGKASGKMDRSPAGRSSPQARAASPAGVHYFEADRRDSERESTATTKTRTTTATTTVTTPAPGRSRTEEGAVRDEQRGDGRAAAMSDLYEFRGGMGGALQWLKDRVSDRVAGGRQGDERREAAKWQGVD